MEDLIEFIRENSKRILLISGALFLLFAFFLVGKYVLTDDDATDESDRELYEELMAEEQQGEAMEEVIVQEAVEAPSEIVVDVKGAVNVPGVYVMAPGSRIIDAVAKAGGLMDTAEQNAVNLAQIVEDQMVIYVPEIGEEGFDFNTAVPSATNGETNSPEGSSLININTADKEALMTLSGIGDVKADNILSYREENGAFQSIEEIKNVSGIGEATFENLKDAITVSQ